MDALSESSLTVILLIFILSAAVVVLAGVRLTAVAETLSRETRLGQALVGAIFLGATTSLSGTVVSVSAAAGGHAALAASNAVGGIAVQTFFLAVADITYRRVNLEHAAAEVSNLIHGALLIALLALPLIAYLTPAYTVFWLHPVSLVLPFVYWFGLRLVEESMAEPMWGPKRTAETRTGDQQHSRKQARWRARPVLTFGVLALAVGVAGYALAMSGLELADRTGLDEGVLGALLTAVVTSTPELVTSLAAVRRGALTLAVAGILGGNAFDVLFLALSDAAYRAGSIYHALESGQLFIIVVTILMTAVLVLGLLRREKHGFANIGFESVVIIALYFGTVALLVQN